MARTITIGISITNFLLFALYLIGESKQFTHYPITEALYVITLIMFFYFKERTPLQNILLAISSCLIFLTITMLFVHLSLPLASPLMILNLFVLISFFIAPRFSEKTE
ncbi:MAG: hypothetical protein LBN08_07170 [Lactobacillales bacterium]|nr:hypothetical protein [Lactobacillales bacterium]